MHVSMWLILVYGGHACICVANIGIWGGGGGHACICVANIGIWGGADLISVLLILRSNLSILLTYSFL